MSHQSLEDKRLLAVAIEERRRRVRENGIKYYVPQEQQEPFHRSKARIRAAFGANRSGKTVSGACDAVWYATGTHPYKDIPVPNYGRIVGTDFANGIEKVIQPELDRWLPKNMIKQRPSVNHRQYILTNGSTIDVMSADQDTEKFSGASRHWCIAEGQRVFMADGTYKPIEDVVVGDSVVSKDGSGKTVTRAVLAKHDNGVKDVYELMSRRGLWLQCTPDHVVYSGLRTKQKAIDIDKLYLSDIGWSPEKTEYKPKSFYPWLGLVLSEGTYKSRKVTMGAVDVIETAKKYLPATVKIRRQDMSKYNHVDDWYISNWPEFWKEVPAGLAHEKYVPDWVFRSSNENIALFLRYLYAGDGWASAHMVGYASTSRRLTEDVVLLLRRLGVRSSMYFKKSQKPGTWRDQWYVLITSSDHVITFNDTVGIEGKQTALMNVVATARERVKSKENRAGIFVGVGAAVAKWKKQNNKAKERYSSLRGKQFMGEKRVYDLTIERDHRFYVGTSLVSNCWFDEEPPKRIFDECRMRLIDFKGDAWITMTPDKGMSWVYSEIYEKANDPNIDVFNFGIYDNPYIDNDEVDMIKRGLSEGQIEAKIYGKFVQMSGLIYREYNKDTHTIDGKFLLPSHWPRICSIDPHPRKTTAVLYMAVAPQSEFKAQLTKQELEVPEGISGDYQDIYIIYDEIYPEKPLLIRETAELMKVKEGMDNISYRLIDNSANTPDPISGGTIRKEFEKYDIRTILASKDIPARIFKVRERLATKSLFFIDGLHETEWEIRHYAWDDFKMGRDWKDPKELPRKKRDDQMDNLGYMCLSSPRFDSPRVYRPARATVDVDSGY